jgi:hypothetical protein
MGRRRITFHISPPAKPTNHQSPSASPICVNPPPQGLRRDRSCAHLRFVFSFACIRVSHFAPIRGPYSRPFAVAVHAPPLACHLPVTKATIAG